MEYLPHHKKSESEIVLDMLKIWFAGRFTFPKRSLLFSYLFCFFLIINIEPSSSIAISGSSLALVPKEKVVVMNIKKDDRSK